MIWYCYPSSINPKPEGFNPVPASFRFMARWAYVSIGCWLKSTYKYIIGWKESHFNILLYNKIRFFEA